MPKDLEDYDSELNSDFLSKYSSKHTIIDQDGFDDIDDNEDGFDVDEEEDEEDNWLEELERAKQRRR